MTRLSRHRTTLMAHKWQLTGAEMNGISRPALLRGSSAALRRGHAGLGINQNTVGEGAKS